MMLNSHRATPLCKFGLLAAVCVAPLSAAPVEIENPSFEKQPPSNGTTSVTDWQKDDPNDAFGVFTPARISVFTNARGTSGDYDGDDVAFSDGGIVRQVTEEQFDPFTKYDLSVLIGRRDDRNVPFGGFAIRLVVNGIVIAEESATGSASTSQFPAGRFTEVTATFDPRVSLVPVGAPGAVVVELEAPSRQTSFDLVRLESTVVPEPAAGMAVAVGLATLARRRR